MDSNLTVERVRQLLDYDPKTGRLVNRVSRGAAKAGKPAGGYALNGYRAVAVDGKRYFEHRLAWLYVHGVWPTGDIDHINGDRSDNRLSNIRDVPKKVNCQNLGGPKSHNQIGFLGVRRMRNKFQARIVLDGKTSYLGTFATPEQAANAYVAAKLRLHAGSERVASKTDANRGA